MPLSRARKSTRREKQRRLRRSLARGSAAHAFLDERAFPLRDAPIKMSKVLLDFIDPYRDDRMSPSQLRRLVSVGIFAWNLALLPPESRGEVVDKASREFPSQRAEPFRQIVSELIERKQQYFPEVTRVILGHELIVTPEGPHLT